MTFSPYVLADKARLERFALLGVPKRVFSEHRLWTDSERMPWALHRIERHCFAVSALGAGWTFDPAGIGRRSDEYDALRAKVRGMTPEEAESHLADLVGKIRRGPLVERVLWAIYRHILRGKQSLLRLPDTLLQGEVWGDAYPQHWRGELRGILDGLSHLHLTEEGGAELGQNTAVLTHFADLRGSPNDRCDQSCPDYGSPPHSHFLINIGRGFLGILEQCGQADDATGIRIYDFPAKRSKSTGPTLSKLGKTGRLQSMYLPAKLGARSRCNELAASQHRMLQAIVRERTRELQANRKSFTAPEVVSGKSVPNAQGRAKITCPFLEQNGRYIGFNGNGRRRGCGYLLSSQHGWLAKCGYAARELRCFFDDLAALSQRLGLIVTGLLPGTNPPQWHDLQVMQAMAYREDVRLQRLHLRIYSAAGYEESWNSFFGWPSPSSSTSQSREDAESEVANLLVDLKCLYDDVACGDREMKNVMSEIISGARTVFENNKGWADKAIAQVPDDKLHAPLDANTNSIAVIIKHVAGNVLSRWTDFLTTDGEKPWRNRDDEFVDTFANRSEALEFWEKGWHCLFETLDSLSAEDLDKTITIVGVHCSRRAIQADEDLPSRCQQRCRRRDDRVLESFDRWLGNRRDELARRLERVIDQMPSLEKMDHRACSIALAKIFRPNGQENCDSEKCNMDSSIALVRLKNAQFSHCKNCVRSQTPLDPALARKMDEIIDKLLALHKRERTNITLNPEQRRTIDAVMDWVKQSQLDNWNPLRAAFETFGAGPPSGPLAIVPLLEVLELLRAAQLRRRLGSSWGTGIHVCDLFAFPIGGSYEFQEWIGRLHFTEISQIVCCS